MLWNALSPTPTKFIVEALTPKVMVFEGRAFVREVIKVKQDP